MHRLWRALPAVGFFRLLISAVTKAALSSCVSSAIRRPAMSSFVLPLTVTDDVKKFGKGDGVVGTGGGFSIGGFLR